MAVAVNFRVYEAPTEAVPVDKYIEEQIESGHVGKALRD